MVTHTFAIPATLGMPRILTLCRELSSLPDADHYELDFSATQHFEPFGMLLLGSAIRRLRERDLGNGLAPTVDILGKSLAQQGHDYAHHLGFWQSVGDQSGLASVMRTASDKTIPITQLSYADLFKQAGGRDPIRAELVAEASAHLATTLSGGPERTPLWAALEYCFREMMRNAFEHGGTDSVWYTGATRPNKDDVQIGILDEGRGIKHSLALNPRERHPSDVHAIRAALRPGVSRNANKTRDLSLTEKLLEEFPGQDPFLYDNSGYGLTFTSNIGREAGQFAVVSGSASVAFRHGHEFVSGTQHVGTAVRIVLHPSELDRALERAQRRIPDGTPRSQSLITASMLNRLGLDLSKLKSSSPT